MRRGRGRYVTWLLGVSGLLWAAGCAGTFPVVEPSAMAPTERSARGVELCVAYQERFERPLWNAVQAIGEPWDFAIASVLIRHPAGLVLLDPAYGRSIGRELGRAGPAFGFLAGSSRTKRPLVDVLAEAGVSEESIDFALLTHVHWDHAGALGDLSRAKVLVQDRELEWVRHFDRFLLHEVMAHHLKRAKERLFTFPLKGPPIDGFDSSFDVFGDGAIVAVPLPGHTPGSVGYLVRGAHGRTYFFIGDTAWALEGVGLPAHKTLPIDQDRARLEHTLARVKAAATARPDLVVVPAHDGRALGRLPTCGQGARAQVASPAR